MNPTNKSNISLAQFSPVFIVLCLLSLSSLASAQGAPNDYQIGFPAHADFSGSEFENVQLNNGNLHIEIPLSSMAGRGLPTGFKYVYDSKGWGIKEHCPHIDPTDCIYWVVPNPSQGYSGCCSDNHLKLTLVGPESFGIKNTTTSGATCNNVPGFITHSYDVTAPDGTRHHMVPDPLWQSSTGICANHFMVGTTVYADDGSGWLMHTDPTNGAVLNAIAKDGTSVTTTVEDTNGNQLTSTDTLGRPITNGLSYYDSNGMLQPIQVTYQDVAIFTGGCDGACGNGGGRSSVFRDLEPASHHHASQWDDVHIYL